MQVRKVTDDLRLRHATVRYCFAVVAFLVLVTFDPTRAVAAPIKVACVGDSITQNSGWSDRLGAKLGAGYKSTNYGVSGTTLLKKGDNPYWNTAAYTQSHSSNPDIVVIMLGTNDSKPSNWNAHRGEFVGDYEALIDSYAALPSHPKIYLNLCPPAGNNGYQINGVVIENEVQPDIKQVAAAKSVPTIDVFDAFGGHTLDPSLYGSPGDLVHPNGKGAQVIADTVYAALVAMVSDGGTDGSGVREAGVGDARDDAADSGAGGAAGSSSDAASAGGPDATSAGGAAGMGPAPGAGGADGGGLTGSAGAAGGQGTGGASATPPREAGTSGGCTLVNRSAGGSGHVVCVSLVVLVLARRRRAR
ncbi:MAG TPA: GDSL-type esterase/lipase family protein [Polyangia bacterium]|jgi:lysophospholipase L1-like esterase|nr:GDSL-type esterase/lipase family protein [Polyangia bacterium]